MRATAHSCQSVDRCLCRSKKADLFKLKRLLTRTRPFTDGQSIVTRAERLDRRTRSVCLMNATRATPSSRMVLFRRKLTVRWRGATACGHSKAALARAKHGPRVDIRRPPFTLATHSPTYFQLVWKKNDNSPGVDVGPESDTFVPCVANRCPSRRRTMHC